MKLTFTPAGLKTPLQPRLNRNLDVMIPDWEHLALTGAPFDSSHDYAAFSCDAAQAPVTLGHVNEVGITLGGGASASLLLDLVWPGDRELPAFLEDLSRKGLLPARPAEDRPWLALQATGASSVKGNAAGKPAPYLAAMIGLETAGDVEFMRLVSFDPALPATQVVADFFSTLDWPLPAIGGAPLSLAPDERYRIAYRGNVKLSAGLKAGYEFSGFHGAELRDLAPRLDYRLSVGARLDMDFRIGGAFSLVLLPGSQAGRIRLVLSKQSQVGGTIGVGLDIGGDYAISGLPEKPADVIKGLFGLDVGQALEWLDFIRTHTFAEACDMAGEKFADKGAQRLGVLLEPFVGQALSSGAYQQFQAYAAQVLAAPGALQEKIPSILSAYEGRRQDLGKVLDLIGAESAKGHLRDLSDSDAWTFVVDHGGEAVIDLLSDTPAARALFSRVAALKTALDAASPARLVTFIDDFQKRTDVAALLALVKAASTPADLQARLGAGLQKLADLVFGKLAAQLAASATAGRAYADIRALADKIVEYQEKLETVLAQARKQAFEASAGLKFGSANERSALVDVEIDTTSPDGLRLFAKAARGDFADALKPVNSRHVHLRECLLREVEAETRALSLAAFGWSWTSTNELKQVLETTVKIEKGGYVYLFGGDTGFTQAKSSGRAGGLETVRTHFSIQALADAVDVDPAKAAKRDLVLRAIRGMTVGYALGFTDQNTLPEELRDYLLFAADLDLLDLGGAGADQWVDDYVAQLRADFPDGLGRVEADYVVRFSPTALLDTLRSTAAPLSGQARAALRRFFKRTYGRRDRGRAERTALADYLICTSVERRHGAGGVRNHGAAKHYNLHFTDAAGRQDWRVIHNENGALVYSWFQEETDYLAAFNALDRAVDSPVNQSRLDEAVRVFVRTPESRKLLGSALWDENVFFLAVDSLLREVGHAKREAALTLKITPPDAGARSGGTITRVFASPANPA